MVRYERRGFAFYHSSDLLHWTRLSRLGGFYECPDLFELPVDGAARETRWVLVAADGAYPVGAFDSRRFVPETRIASARTGRQASLV
jgi:fructan beta-fructosidase